MFTDLFIKKPIYAYVLSIFILLLGFVGFQKLSLRQYPEITPSVISVDVAYPGASAKDIELFVTKPLEEALAAVDHLDYVTSSSSIGKSSIIMNFKQGTDVNKALSDAYTSVAIAKENLPKDIREPVIKKLDPNKSPLIYLGLLSNYKWSHADLTEYFERAVKPSMQNIAGVGMVKIFGEYDYGMHLNLDPIKLAAFGLSQKQFMDSIANESVYPSIARLESRLLNYPLSMQGQANMKQDFGNIVVHTIDKQKVRASQLADIEMRSPKTNIKAVVRGKPAVFLGIVPTSDANPLDVSDKVKALLASFKDILPEDYQIKMFWDSAVFIKQSLSEVQWAIGETTVAVLLILAIFLGSLRLSMVPAVTIPLSLGGTFLLMYLFNFSINTFTLLAMVLAIGMVVDDAIVVLENIYRHIEEGLSPREAALVGAREICHPVIVMTLTLAAVFAPIGFVEGLTGTLFREFAFTLAGSVVISGVVALTLSPLMCEKVLASSSHETKLAKMVNSFFTKLTDKYLRILDVILPKKKTVFSLIALLTVMTGAGIVFMPSALVPPEDSGILMSFISGPPGANINYMEPYTQEFDKRASKIEGIKDTAVINGFMGDNTAMAIAILKPWKQRKDTAATLAQVLQDKTKDIAGIKAFVVNPFAVPGASKDMPLGFVVKTFGSLNDLDKNMRKLVNSIRDKNSPFYEWRIFFPNTKFQLDVPTYELNLNTERMQDLGVTNRDLGQTLSLALNDREGGRYAYNNQSRNWYAEFQKTAKNNFSELSAATLKLNNGQFVPLNSFFSIKQTVRPSSIEHFQQLRSATFAAAALMPGYTMGQALAHIKKAAESIFPKGTIFDYDSQSRTLIESEGHTSELYIFAIIFIYLVMALQYESFRDPFIILMCVPLAGLGAIALLFTFGGSINMYTNIGMVTLIGLITKHGILIVDFANRKLAEGMVPAEAAREAASTRLRPIILTTVAMVLAAVPLVFATGAGNVARNQMGLTILGGMSIGTLLSLFVVPTVFTHLRFKKR